ncbi:MAG: ThuA domain-containing protein [Phycisphaeraceae bacterium]
MAKQALIVYGGWDGHTPKESAELFAEILRQDGYEVVLKDTLDAYLDTDLMSRVDLIVPVWTMGEISNEQWQGLDRAVRDGAGVAGFHGGMIDSFRTNTEYQWMTGAQWVSHPGNCDASYEVRIADPEHPITKGLSDFTLDKTEQYYCHFDPGVHVLCTTTFTGEFGDASLYKPGTVMPYAWTKTWGKGKVFGACWGHTYQDFDEPTAREIVRRGMHWATR